MRPIRVMRLARWPARSRSSGGGAICGSRRARVGSDGSEAEEVAQFIVSAAEPGGRSGAFEAPHGPVATFDAPVVLLQPVVQVGTGSVPHILAELGPDRPGVA